MREEHYELPDPVRSISVNLAGIQINEASLYSGHLSEKIITFHNMGYQVEMKTMITIRVGFL
jgi:hypothetical protein